MFAKYVDQMHNTCEMVNSNPQSGTALARLVCGGLQQLSSRSAEFDAVVASEFPFKKHFFELLTSLRKVDDGVLLQLFEDLALFMRARALTVGAETLSQEEKAILDYFETSGEWKRGDRALVTESYWYELPEQVRKA